MKLYFVGPTIGENFETCMLGTILNLDMHERVFKSGRSSRVGVVEINFPCPTHGLLRITSPSRAPPTADASAGEHPLVAAVLFFLGECIKTGTPRLAHTAQVAGSAGQSPPSRFIARSGTVQRPNGLFRYRPSYRAPWLRSACGALWLRPAHRGAAARASSAARTPPPPCMRRGEWVCRLLCCGHSCCLCRAARSDSDRSDIAAPSSVARQPRARPRETERFLGHDTCAAAINAVLAKRQARKQK